MQRCADCGHPNRPGVRFCTHCGKPAAASEATTKGPTAVVAVAVLAVGLFAFLNIRPMGPREAKTAAIEVAMPVVGSPALPAADPAPDVLQSPDLVLPAAAPLAMPAMPAPPPAPTAPSPVLRKEAAPRARVSSTPVSSSPVPSSPAPSSPTPRRPANWLHELRAELAACEGDFFARTICRETAKFRHCASAGAWGKVPECPAARLPDLANFN